MQETNLYLTYDGAKKIYSEMASWAGENKIFDYDTFVEMLETESPDPFWTERIDNKQSTQSYFLRYFELKAKTEARKRGRMSHRKSGKHKRAVPCICIDTGKTFRSFAEAGRWLGVNGILISDCCYGVRKSVRGHRFQLAEETKHEE